MDRIQRDEVFRPGIIPIAANDVPAWTGIAEHTHEFLELAVVSRGSGVHVTPGGAVPISVGSVIFIRPGIWHAYQLPEDLWTFNLYLGRGLLQTQFAWIIDFPELAQALFQGQPNLGRLSPDATTRALDWLEQIRRAPAERALTLIGLTTCVLDSLSEVVAAAPHDAETSAIARSVITMMDLMRTDLARRWTIGDLAQAVHGSEAFVYRAFKNHLGMSPMAWLQQERGEHFATELTHTRHAIATIGRSVGWDDPNYASRRFRALFGIAPTEYRRRFARA